MTSKTCKHPVVSTIYLSVWGDIPTTLNALRASDPQETRAYLCVTNLACATCKKKLTRRDLGNRIKLGGDLYDSRFRFAWQSGFLLLVSAFIKQITNR